MDPLSIAASCAGLISAIGALSLSIHGFVRTCREARKDLDKVSRELQSLQLVLGLIEDDATNEEKPFPPVIRQHVSRIISNCNSVILEIEACIAQYGQKQLKARVTWAIGGQSDVEKLRTNLEAHKSSLELALDMHTLTIAKDIKADTTEIRNDTTSIKKNTEQILQEIARLQAQLPKDVTTSNDYVLQRFLEEMTIYTEIASDTTIVGSDNDSIRTFYDVKEVSEASVEEEKSYYSLDTTVEPKIQSFSAADGASEPDPNLTTRPLAAQIRPIEVPIPKSSDGDLGTSNELQPLSLPIRDKVPPGALAVQTSSDDGLVAPKESRPQDLAESFASPGLSKDEAPAPHFNPSSNEVPARECAVVGNTEDKKHRKRMVVLNKSMITRSGKAHVKRLNGNLVFDYRYLNPLTYKGRRASEMTYTNMYPQKAKFRLSKLHMKADGLAILECGSKDSYNPL
ncbi:hypothetical protein CEP54_000293 [Fusarium duplospermum]|uniref:Azaphilone pigments biosynthesis cluster protein L N-terminal domain-containing protein n=1 Tax=Fusarium duplospermum TaxID=1325734 RepID=A0A428R8L3_9HYPO|nr:hypothetical protein CEP54_000293 [Fusarium duplospermum]